MSFATPLQRRRASCWVEGWIDDDAQLTVVIIDNGIGLNGASITAGLGLGLYLMRELADAQMSSDWRRADITREGRRPGRGGRRSRRRPTGRRQHGPSYALPAHQLRPQASFWSPDRRSDPARPPRGLVRSFRARTRDQ